MDFSDFGVNPECLKIGEPNISLIKKIWKIKKYYLSPSKCDLSISGVRCRILSKNLFLPDLPIFLSTYLYGEWI